MRDTEASASFVAKTIHLIGTNPGYTSFMTGLSGYLHDNTIGSCHGPLLRSGDAQVRVGL